MRVKSCIASDGAGHIIKLSDEFGCVLRPKMISRFLKARAPDERATVLTYAFFHAFKFPDALSVHIKCKVEICRHGCLDHCQVHGNVHERKDTILTDSNEHHDDNNDDDDDEPTNNLNLLQSETMGHHPHNQDDDDDVFGLANHDTVYDDIIHHGDDLAAIGGIGASPLSKPTMKVPQVHETPEEDEPNPADKLIGKEQKVDEKFPHGPRRFETVQNRMGMPAVAGPRSMRTDDSFDKHDLHTEFNGTGTKRKRRSVVISDRKVRSADVGVSGLYEVISEADLAFNPDGKQEAVTVFQGKITEDVVYGICMPVPGFSVLFIVIASAAIVAALVAGSLLYRYQLQKESMKRTIAPDTPQTLASWMTLRLFRMRPNISDVVNQQSNMTQ